MENDTAAESSKLAHDAGKIATSFSVKVLEASIAELGVEFVFKWDDKFPFKWEEGSAFTSSIVGVETNEASQSRRARAKSARLASSSTTPSQRLLESAGGLEQKVLPAGAGEKVLTGLEQRVLVLLLGAHKELLLLATTAAYTGGEMSFAEVFCCVSRGNVQAGPLVLENEA